jgi:recombination protein RecR
VEEPADIYSIERSGGFNGRYHALMGKLSPSRQSGPSALRLGALAERVARGGVNEVLLALSTDMEGDTTAGYIGELLRPSGVRVTRLAFGLPADSGVGYSDPLTLKRAISGRIACD